MVYKQLYVNMQFIRFIRRTEGVEAARKYFLDARKSPNCSYHVFVAYATMAFCMDKDPKVILTLCCSLSVFVLLFDFDFHILILWDIGQVSLFKICGCDSKKFMNNNFKL